jgi:hypothetical protein
VKLKRSRKRASPQAQKDKSHEYHEISAILILKIGFLKASRRLAFKKPILSFPVPAALENSKLVS